MHAPNPSIRPCLSATEGDAGLVGSQTSERRLLALQDGFGKAIVLPRLKVEWRCSVVDGTAECDPQWTPDPLATIGSEPTLRRCLSNSRRNRPSACHRPGPAELPQTTRRDGVARAGQCLCQTARSIRRKPLLFNANTQTETFVAPCRDFITFLFVCSHAADIRHEDTGLPWDIGADVP